MELVEKFELDFLLAKPFGTCFNMWWDRPLTSSPWLA